MDTTTLVLVLVAILVVVLFVVKGESGGDTSSGSDAPTPPEDKSTGNEQDSFRSPKS
ncbi:MAG: hypothetical protein GKS04_00815 [Candidatus Mycalebacterium zealandia]|nr:MAG: hypothetical protein GKS04_00815 [Candidatus Mycalebacterium zealandia]